MSDCARMQDSSFCYACADCKNIFGCTHLKNKSFCILNRQLTEEEYMIWEGILERIEYSTNDSESIAETNYNSLPYI